MTPTDCRSIHAGFDAPLPIFQLTEQKMRSESSSLGPTNSIVDNYGLE